MPKITHSKPGRGYDIIFHDSLTGLPGQNYAMMSYSGDIDSDGQEELLWAVKNNWMIYKATGNNTLERVYMAYPHPQGNRLESTSMLVCDINGNGYPEIIEAREDYSPNFIQETVIWEIEGVRLHRPNGGEVLNPGSQYPITWEKFTPPDADSFSSFVCFDNGRNFRTITTGIPTNDTLYLWNVPDSLSDSCKIMIWAYGPPRAGQSTPRGVDWDFSDFPFAIGQTQVKEETRNQKLELRLEMNQNPSRSDVRLKIIDISNKDIEMKIYDIAGQLVTDLSPPIVANTWFKIALNPGVYFLHLDDGKMINVKKVVVVE